MHSAAGLNASAGSAPFSRASFSGQHLIRWLIRLCPPSWEQVYSLLIRGAGIEHIIKYNGIVPWSRNHTRSRCEAGGGGRGMAPASDECKHRAAAHTKRCTCQLSGEWHPIAAHLFVGSIIRPAKYSGPLDTDTNAHAETLTGISPYGRGRQRQ